MVAGELLIGSPRTGMGSSFSGTLVATVSVPSVVSLLRRFRETLDSWLVSLWRPTLPSFSIAMKFARTLVERGLESEARPVGKYG